MVIGVMVDDGVVKVHPPIERAMKEVVAKLKTAGHEIVQWQASGHQEIIDILDAYYTADGGHDIRIAVQEGGEPFIPHVEALINRGKAISVFDYWQLNRRKLAASKAYLDKWATTCGPSGRVVDILLTPVAPNTAVPHKSSRWVGYTKVWNVLDYTALTFPATTTQYDVDLLPDGYEPRNELDSWNWGIYDKDASDGMPVGLQIVGRKLEEEKVLGAAKVVESVMR
jgi:Asp-tRNA(Asn)/Glu-tRNA(Gln) amidotransferase A subunit family amidase